MKKALTALVLAFCTLLCGCSRAAEYREPEQVIITAALGFDNINGNLLASAETVNTALGDNKTQVLKCIGITAEQAIETISDKLYGELFLGHCATVILGHSLTEDQISDIIKFLKDNRQLSLAVKLITCENAAELLLCKSYSGEGVGYDIIKLLTPNGDISSSESYAGLFWVENLRNSDNKSFTLPCFTASFSEVEPTLGLDGVDVFSGTLRTYKLTKEQNTLLEILSNSFSSGTLTLKNGNEILQAAIEKSSCKFKSDYLDDRLIIDCTVNLTAERGGFKGKDDEFGKAIEKNLRDFFQILQTKVKEDILHITDGIKKYEPSIYKEIKEDVLSAFLGAEINVTCCVSRGDRQ